MGFTTAIMEIHKYLQLCHRMGPVSLLVIWFQWLRLQLLCMVASHCNLEMMFLGYKDKQCKELYDPFLFSPDGETMQQLHIAMLKGGKRTCVTTGTTCWGQLTALLLAAVVYIVCQL